MDETVTDQRIEARLFWAMWGVAIIVAGLVVVFASSFGKAAVITPVVVGAICGVAAGISLQVRQLNALRRSRSSVDIASLPTRTKLLAQLKELQNQVQQLRREEDVLQWSLLKSQPIEVTDQPAKEKQKGIELQKPAVLCAVG